MAFETISTRRDGLHAWYATRPDLFRQEPWVGRIVLWSIVAVAMIALFVLALVNPAGVIDIIDGERRPGSTVIALYVIPPVIAALALRILFRSSVRFRMVGVGPLKSAYALQFGNDLDPATALAVIECGSADPTNLENLFRSIAQSTGAVYRIEGYANAAARVAVTGIQRRGQKQHTIEWEPVITRGDAYFDGRALAKRTGTA